METWTCPACFEPLSAGGPGLLRLAIAEHIRAHETKVRGPSVPPPPSNAQWVGPAGARRVLTETPMDEAFYDGARLTEFDGGWLKSLRVEWAHPR